MMHYSKVAAGIVRYLDDEIVAKMAGSWKAWALGSALGIAYNRAGEILHNLADNPTAKALGIINGEEIDVDAIYNALRVQAGKRNATIDLPLVGSITFSQSDVESLYRHIMEA